MEPCHGVQTVESLRWNLCFPILALESWLWNPGCEVLWKHRCEKRRRVAPPTTTLGERSHDILDPPPCLQARRAFQVPSLSLKFHHLSQCRYRSWDPDPDLGLASSTAFLCRLALGTDSVHLALDLAQSPALLGPPRAFRLMVTACLCSEIEDCED